MHRHLLLLCLLATCLRAGEAAPAPLATLTIADGPALLAHWQASLYQRVWSDPGLAPLHERWQQTKASLTAETGLDLDAALAAFGGLQAQLDSVNRSGLPAFRVQAECGAQAQVIFRLLTATAGLPAEVVGADEARLLAAAGPVLARHGTRLVIAHGSDAVPWPAAASTADVRLRLDYRRFSSVIHDMTSTLMDEAEAERQRRLLVEMEPWMGMFDWAAWLKPEGLHEVIDYDKPSPGVLPVDRALLDRFPANALGAGAIGIDLDAMWPMLGASWLASLDPLLHAGETRGTEAVVATIDGLLAAKGVTGGLAQLRREAKGTIAVAVTPSMPFPAGSVAVPRSPATDALVAASLAAIGGTMPAEDDSAIVPVPNFPVLVQVVRGRTHWLATSDAALAAIWPAGQPGGFLASRAGAAMLAQAPADAYAIGGADITQLVQLLQPMVAMLGGRQDPGLRRALPAALARFARESGPTTLWSTAAAASTRTEVRGPIGIGVIPVAAIIGAIAIPNLLESRVAANEAAAGATLRSGIFPAQVQFQAGGYMDQDNDNRGEYGTLGELSGRVASQRMEAGRITLLAGPLAHGDTANGHRFRIYLPDGAGGAITSDDAARPALPAAADAQELHFIAYAWPVDAEQGHTMFALSADGQLRSLPWDGEEPEWDSALPQGWGKPSHWPIHGAHRERQMPEAEPRAPDPDALF